MGELLAAVVQEAGEGFCLEVGDLVGADVAALGEALMADVAFKGLFACVAALMGLYRGCWYTLIYFRVRSSGKVCLP